MEFYITVCSRHKSHDDDCTACRQFDKACREKLDVYLTPPSQHPTVVAAQTREWIGSIFPVVKS